MPAPRNPTIRSGEGRLRKSKGAVRVRPKALAEIDVAKMVRKSFYPLGQTLTVARPCRVSHIRHSDKLCEHVSLNPSNDAYVFGFLEANCKP